jgi:hypothetical protein
MDMYISFRNGTIPKIGAGERLEPTEIEMLFLGKSRMLCLTNNLILVLRR